MTTAMISEALSWTLADAGFNVVGSCVVPKPEYLDVVGQAAQCWDGASASGAHIELSQIGEPVFDGAQYAVGFAWRSVNASGLATASGGGRVVGTCATACIGPNPTLQQLGITQASVQNDFGSGFATVFFCFMLGLCVRAANDAVRRV